MSSKLMVALLECILVDSGLLKKLKNPLKNAYELFKPIKNLSGSSIQHPMLAHLLVLACTQAGKKGLPLSSYCPLITVIQMHTDAKPGGGM